MTSRHLCSMGPTLLVVAATAGSAAGQPLEQAPPPPQKMQHRVGGTVTLGYTFGWMFGVPIRYGELQMAVGWTGQKGDIGIDIGGLASLGRGETQAGRTINLLTLGTRAVFRYDLLRFGFGVGVGQIGVRRSTKADDPETSLTLDPYVSVGFEPVRWDGHALFLEVQGHLVDFGTPASTLALGMRF